MVLFLPLSFLLKIRMKRSFEDEQRVSAVKIRNGLENLPVPIPNALPSPSFPSYLFSLPTIHCFCGPRGSGKTTACINLLAEYIIHGAFTHLWVISPTLSGNPELALLFVLPTEICEHVEKAPAFLQSMQSTLKEEGEIWRANEWYKRAYARYRNGNPTQKDIVLLERAHYILPLDLPRPAGALLIDDMTHTPLFSPSLKNPLNSLAVIHRHVGGYGCGLSIFCLVHNFLTGMCKKLRQNTRVFHLFETADTTQLDSVHKETVGVLPLAEFKDIFLSAIHPPGSNGMEQSHHFLTIDPYNSNKAQRFRRDFDVFLMPPSFTHMGENKPFSPSDQGQEEKAGV